MGLKDRIQEVLDQRAFEIHDGPTKLKVIDATDFEQIAMDLQELLQVEFDFEEKDSE